MRFRPLALSVLLILPSRASADWQVKPFLGVTFGGGTTFVDLEEAVGEANVSVGASVTLLGELLGLEADFAWGPGFFQSDAPPPLPGGTVERRVTRSSVVTLTGNVIVALPKRMTEYTLRPYVAGGFGVVRSSIEDAFHAFPLKRNLPAVDVGGGVTGFLTRRIGVSWDLRYFRTKGGEDRGDGLSIGDPRLSFWRANMALTLRY